MMAQMVTVLDVDLNCSPQHCTTRQNQLLPAALAKDYSSSMEQGSFRAPNQRAARASVRSRSVDMSHQDLIPGLGPEGADTAGPWCVDFKHRPRQQDLPRVLEGSTAGPFGQQCRADSSALTYAANEHRLVAMGREPSGGSTARLDTGADSAVEIIFVQDVPTRQQEMEQLCKQHGMPHQQHRLPHQQHRLPHQQHGLPRQLHGLPHQQHGLPHQQHGLPHQQHGLPHQQHAEPCRPQEVHSQLRPRRGTPGSGSLDTFLGRFGSEIEDLCIIHCDEDSIPFSTPMRLPPAADAQDVSGLPTCGLGGEALANGLQPSGFTPATVSSPSVHPRAAVEFTSRTKESRPAPVLPPLRQPRMPRALELPSPGAMSPMSVGTSPCTPPQFSDWNQMLNLSLEPGTTRGQGPGAVGSGTPRARASAAMVPLTPQGNSRGGVQPSRHRRMTSYDSGLPGFPGFTVPGTPSGVTPKPKPPKSPATPGRSPLLSPAELKALASSAGVGFVSRKAGPVHRRGHSWCTVPAYDSSARAQGGHPSPGMDGISQEAGSFTSPSSSVQGPSPTYRRGTSELSTPRTGVSHDFPLPKSASARSIGSRASSSGQSVEERSRRTPGFGTPPLPNRALPKAHSFSDAGASDKLANQTPKPILVANDGRLRRSQSLGLKVKFHKQVEVVYV